LVHPEERRPKAKELKGLAFWMVWTLTSVAPSVAVMDQLAGGRISSSLYALYASSFINLSWIY
jgi:hypothetical protein